MVKREIRDIIYSTGKSEAELAEIAGVSLSTFRSWYYQQHKMPRLAERILRLLVSQEGLAMLLVDYDKPLVAPRSFRSLSRGAHRPRGSKTSLIRPVSEAESLVIPLERFM
jgi:hypothetical protein